MNRAYDDATNILAVTDAQAKDHFTAGDYALLEIGGHHSLTSAEIKNAGYAFDTYEEAVEFLGDHGGGWTFDTNLDSHWHPPIDTAQTEQVVGV